MTSISEKRKTGRRAKKPLDPKNRASDIFQVESLSAIQDFLKHRPKMIERICVKEKAFTKALDLFPEHQDKLCQVHDLEGAFPIWAEVKLIARAEVLFLDEVKNRQHDLVLMLDHVKDPRNLGAIARSAAFFGVKEIIVPKDRQVGFSAASVATSQAAFAFLELVLVTNLSRIIEKLKKAGYWIVGADMDGVSIEEVAPTYDKVVLVMGSEEKGLSHQIRNKCDLFVGIEGCKNGPQSLNVSVAGGVLLRGFYFSQKSKISG